MTHEVVLPRGDALVHECEVILSAGCFLVYTDAEVHHLARYVCECLVLHELVGHAADGDAEERGACTDGLRHHDGAPFIVDARGHGGCALHAA